MRTSTAILFAATLIIGSTVLALNIAKAASPDETIKGERYAAAAERVLSKRDGRNNRICKDGVNYSSNKKSPALIRTAEQPLTIGKISVVLRRCFKGVIPKTTIRGEFKKKYVEAKFMYKNELYRVFFRNENWTAR